MKSISWGVLLAFISNKVIFVALCCSSLLVIHCIVASISGVKVADFCIIIKIDFAFSSGQQKATCKSGHISLFRELRHNTPNSGVASILMFPIGKFEAVFTLIPVGFWHIFPGNFCWINCSVSKSPSPAGVSRLTQSDHFPLQGPASKGQQKRTSKSRQTLPDHCSLFQHWSLCHILSHIFTKHFLVILIHPSWWPLKVKKNIFL